MSGGLRAPRDFSERKGRVVHRPVFVVRAPVHQLRGEDVLLAPAIVGRAVVILRNIHLGDLRNTTYYMLYSGIPYARYTLYSIS